MRRHKTRTIQVDITSHTLNERPASHHLHDEDNTLAEVWPSWLSAVTPGQSCAQASPWMAKSSHGQLAVACVGHTHTDDSHQLHHNYFHTHVAPMSSCSDEHMRVKTKEIHKKWWWPTHMRSSVRSTDGRTFWMSATLRRQRASKAETCLSALHKIQCNQTTENLASTHSHANNKQPSSNPLPASYWHARRLEQRRRTEQSARMSEAPGGASPPVQAATSQAAATVKKREHPKSTCLT